MEPDDLDPKTKKAHKRNLDPLSVDELQNYIAELQAEITRVEEDIARKKNHLTEAERLFKI